ncbi:isochorismate synthase [Synechococcus sp. RSCCF101]|uniref:isochorismate synthase n=1 Tax=Synechococcus sp. RSCCF101 TaxID=2511069 RepID=UPI001244FFC0|nr:isochorismate synthase [Synechococcus sp. RSCCF101]QEY32839.1 isochorismate synthase [Synechococcus sp. RSCCF101]
MQAGPSFQDLLQRALAAERALLGSRAASGDRVLSLALPVQGLDPLAALPRLAPQEPFRVLWDGAPGLSLAAAGRVQHLELSGPRRFELAQRFADLALGRLCWERADLPPQARPRVLLAFAFFSEPGTGEGVPGVQAVLPRWQLSRQGRAGWLRLQSPLDGRRSARHLAEELWEMAARLEAGGPEVAGSREERASVMAPQRLGGADALWQQEYLQAVKRALELVEDGSLHKLVLAVRRSLTIPGGLHPLGLLERLRRQQAGSCRFLWQRHRGDAFFGASPERLLTVRQGLLRSDALAGTARAGDPGEALLRSEKDRREHALVVDTITDLLRQQQLQPRCPRRPRLARHGSLVHLHTPITAAISGRSPLSLAEVLHPTPAVAGLPRRAAMDWLRTLEPFERGHYAAPIGWIDGEGDAELRVAIRSGHLRGDQLELCAGAGLVRGSVVERELQEVAMKLAVLTRGDEGAQPAPRSVSSRAIT